MENQKNSQVLFVLSGGVLLTIVGLAYFHYVTFLLYDKLVLLYCGHYLLEFIFYCIAAKLYIKFVDRKLWFSKGLVVLSILTGFKVVLTALFTYVVLSYLHLFVEPGIHNFFDVLGPLMRGFMIEFALIALAAKIFETDIFEPNNDLNERIIDDLK